MAKDTERKAAYVLYVLQMKSAKEVSLALKVQEKTLGTWVKEGKWKEERNSRMNKDKNRADKVKDVIDNLADQSIELTKELEAAKLLKDKEAILNINKQLVAVSQQVAMYNKVLGNIDKDAKFSLETYLSIMELIFNALQAYDNDVYMKTLDFQSEHMQAATLMYA